MSAQNRRAATRAVRGAICREPEDQRQCTDGVMPLSRPCTGAFMSGAPATGEEAEERHERLAQRAPPALRTPHARCLNGEGMSLYGAHSEATLAAALRRRQSPSP